MGIEFRSSKGSSLGIEVELGIVDRTTRELVPEATWLLDRIGAGHPDDEHPKAKHELFECTVEVITGVCTTVAEARADLDATITELSALGARRNLALMGSGTHPTTHWSSMPITPDPRYVDLIDRIQWPARRLAIHGVHVHVGVRSREKAIAITNSLAFHLPQLLALSASSPYWHGLDTGLASCRTKIFEGLPTAGLPPQLAGWGEFEALMRTLITAKAIESIREIWWDVRPHPNFGTVELRMCDGLSNLTEVAAIAALAQSLVQSLDERIDAGEDLPSAPNWVIRENKWVAARYGLDAELIVDADGHLQPARDTIEDLVTTLMPTAEVLGCAAELDAVLGILQRGPSYVRQRQVVDGGGSLHDVVDLLVDELTHGAPRPA
jgi:carboxylate-amine ligase